MSLLQLLQDFSLPPIATSESRSRQPMPVGIFLWGTCLCQDSDALQARAQQKNKEKVCWGLQVGLTGAWASAGVSPEVGMGRKAAWPWKAPDGEGPLTNKLCGNQGFPGVWGGRLLKMLRGALCWHFFEHSLASRAISFSQAQTPEDPGCLGGFC